MPFVTEMRSGLKEVIAGPEIQQITCILPISAETQDGRSGSSVRKKRNRDVGHGGEDLSALTPTYLP